METDDLEYIENNLPVHVINRSIPLRIQGSEPRQCLDIIDGMYNNYYEIEVQYWNDNIQNRHNAIHL